MCTSSRREAHSGPKRRVTNPGAKRVMRGAQGRIIIRNGSGGEASRSESKPARRYCAPRSERIEHTIHDFPSQMPRSRPARQCHDPPAYRPPYKDVFQLTAIVGADQGARRDPT